MPNVFSNYKYSHTLKREKLLNAEMTRKGWIKEKICELCLKEWVRFRYINSKEETPYRRANMGMIYVFV